MENSHYNARSQEYRKEEVRQVSRRMYWRTSYWGAAIIGFGIYGAGMQALFQPILGLITLLITSFWYLVWQITGNLICRRIIHKRLDLSIARIIEIHVSVNTMLWTGSFALSILLGAALSGFHRNHGVGTCLELLVVVGGCAAASRKIIAGLQAHPVMQCPYIVTSSTFDEAAVKALEYAKTAALKNQKAEADTRYIFLGVITDYNCVGAQVLRGRALDQQDVQKWLDLQPRDASLSNMDGASIGFSQSAKKLLDVTTQTAQRGRRPATSNDLFFAVLQVPETQNMLQALGLNVHELQMIHM